MPKATTLPVIRSTPTYITSDNVPFTNKKDATIHELGLQLREALLPHFQDNGELKRICLKIAKNHPTYKVIFEKIGRAHRMTS
jgi:hypothetical protein